MGFGLGDIWDAARSAVPGAISGAAATGSPWGALLGGGLSLLAGNEAQKTANRAADQQFSLGKALIDMQQQQFNQADMPLRLSAFGQLQNQLQRQRPRMTPGRMPVVNPYTRVRKLGAAPTLGQARMAAAQGQQPPAQQFFGPSGG